MNRTRPEADVCVLLEGTYPYVRGGVASWVHQIISGLSDLSFALIFIGGRRSDYSDFKYELPKNAIHLESHYLEDAFAGRRPKPVHMSRESLHRVEVLHDYLKANNPNADVNRSEKAEQTVNGVLETLERKGGINSSAFLGSDASFSFIRRAYLADDPDAPFVDYFWTLRMMHGPIFQLAQIAERAPSARIYHTVSTGYAGFLGAMIAIRRKRPLVLSEHGIYTKERRIDLNQAEWIEKLHGSSSSTLGDPFANIREIWIRYFEGLGRFTYRTARPIISLYSGNRARQLEDGAAHEHTRIIVNGIDLERFAPAFSARPERIPRVIGFIGRVVPIKDVKTFIRAIYVVVSTLPDTEAWVIGNSEEDPAYAAECKALANSLGLNDRVRFLGHREIVPILPKLGLLMLTSISEAQPLVILEGFASGVPCVATDVGACREQIEGVSAQDKALGPAGRVVGFADADALGRAAIGLLTDEDQWKKCQAAGLARVHRYYAQSSMLDAYRAVYRERMVA